MASQDRLYAELYDYIVDFLHDDEDALRACALVCRDWALASRYHLFYQIRLTGSAPSPTRSWAQNTACRRIFATILSSPHLAAYVNRLTVQETNVVRPSTYRWVSGEIAFPSLLSKLTSLRALEFNFPNPGPASDKTGWSTMAFRDIIEAMTTMSLESLSMRQFSFSSLHDFIKLLDICRHLKTLQLDHVDITTSTTLFSPSALEHVLNMQLSDSMSQTSETKANLETLLLRSNNLSLIIPVLLHPRSFLDLTSVRHLTINVTPESYRIVVELLGRLPNIESLDIEIEHDFDYEAHLEPRDIIDASLMPCLKSLSIQSSILLGRTDPIPWISNTLSTASNRNILEDMSLTCIIDKPPPSLTVQAFDEALVGWHNLDDLLTQPTFNTMKRVRLDFILDNPSGDDTLPSISQEFTKQLQKLSKKGVLEVDFCEAR
ncbi:hypothetical protein D9613_006980 [Agrocybe pediades]|uniref:Uncharacterized protein n=1 Tax=Agrocybe pediades TaxID=84607 RepID=A0A8H4QHP7_9AGAR|nr:hypothetical protein D9613_006980 [Agrocybe pediades]KAF9563112.1 hypothetical protein CPC08DRAFT_761061 [Agrocybe pediades]